MIYVFYALDSSWGTTNPSVSIKNVKYVKYACEKEKSVRWLGAVSSIYNWSKNFSHSAYEKIDLLQVSLSLSYSIGPL